MYSQKHYQPRPLQVLIEPGPGSLAVGYVRVSSAQDGSIDADLQRRRIAEFAESKGWELGARGAVHRNLRKSRNARKEEN